MPKKTPLRRELVTDIIGDAHNYGPLRACRAEYFALL